MTYFVFQDFMGYSSGVYRPRGGGRRMGMHAVTCTGYGQLGGGKVKYFNCQNSWGSAWGEEGFFRIKEKECNMIFYKVEVKKEQPALDGMPKVGSIKPQPGAVDRLPGAPAAKEKE